MRGEDRGPARHETLPAAAQDVSPVRGGRGPRLLRQGQRRGADEGGAGSRPRGGQLQEGKQADRGGRNAHLYDAHRLGGGGQAEAGVSEPGHDPGPGGGGQEARGLLERKTGMGGDPGGARPGERAQGGLLHRKDHHEGERQRLGMALDSRLRRRLRPGGDPEGRDRRRAGHADRPGHHRDPAGKRDGRYPGGPQDTGPQGRQKQGRPRVSHRSLLVGPPLSGVPAGLHVAGQAALSGLYPGDRPGKGDPGVFQGVLSL